jgi:hypothetical protein
MKMRFDEKALHQLHNIALAVILSTITNASAVATPIPVKQAPYSSHSSSHSSNQSFISATAAANTAFTASSTKTNPT